MARRKDSPQKAAMRKMMRDYLKNNDISIKDTGVGMSEEFIKQKLNIEMLNCYQGYLLTLCDIRLVPEWQKRE